jgi:hypothetical protein
MTTTRIRSLLTSAVVLTAAWCLGSLHKAAAPDAAAPAAGTPRRRP